MKLNISMDDNLLERVDAVADANYMSRSGLIAFACSQYINQTELMMSIKELSLSMRKIADSGVISEEDKEQLLDFERFVKMLDV